MLQDGHSFQAFPVATSLMRSLLNLPASSRKQLTRSWILACQCRGIQLPSVKLYSAKPNSSADGWWPANVVDIDGDMLVLQARDFPKAPKVARHRSAVALFFTKDFQAPEQSDDIAPGLPVSWAKLAVGHLVIAQDAKSENGWWEAEIVKIATEKLTLRWKNSPRQPTVTRMRTAVALLNPIPPKQS